MSGSLKAKIIVVVVLLALTAALVGTCIAYRNRACEHTSLEHIEAVEPTCTESGNIEHWACKRCGATFKDESGAEEIGRVVRTALGHDLTRHSAVEPTCTEAGNVEYWECERCGVIFADSAATKPLDDHIVAASGHDWNEPVWDWSDDYSKATAYFVCNKDSEHVESVTAKVTISSASATCTGSGRITYLAKAELDGKTYSDSEVVQSGALGHDWTVSEWIWSNDHTSVTAYFVCSRDPSHTHEVTATDIVINEDPATCLADGKTEYSVTIDFDGNTYSDTAVVTLPATGHNWSNPEWTWSGNYSEATAMFTCLNDPSHTETVNAVVTILSSSATCTEPGNTEYKAELSFNGNVYTDSQSVSGEALGHDWAVVEWIWSKDYTSVTAKFVCARDNSHTRVISGQINEDVIKPATCTEDGESTFTATVSLGGETYTDQKTSVVIKARHVLSEKWSADDVYHWHECTVCGEKRDLSTHELVDFICSVCNHTIIYTEGLEYTLSDDGESYLVSGIGTATDRDIKIMPRYKGKPVTGIADYAFKDKTEVHLNLIKSILIPDSVESIGKLAFDFCGGLQSVTIGNGVTSIGGDAFDNCSNITRVDYLGDITGWLNIEGLANLMIGLSGECELYLGGTKIEGELIIPDGVTSIADHAFVNLSAITSVTIPDSVKSIGNYAFMNCSGLQSVTIGNGVTSIGSYAFEGCSGLTSVTIPNSVTSIGSYAFYECTGLQSVTIGNGVTSIGGAAFSNCGSLTEVTIPDAVTSIGSSAFEECSGLTSVTIPDSVTSIGSSAFEECSGLAEVIIGNGVTSIGGYAFRNCSGLQSVTIGNDVTSIGSYAFRGCSSLTSLTIPDSVTSIEDGAFMNCSGLTSVTIPDSVTSIGSSAFQDCSSLTSVTIGNGVTSIEGGAFSLCYRLIEVYNNSSIDIIAGSSNNGYVAYYAKRVLTNEEDSKLTIDESGFIFYYDGVDNAYLMGYSGNKTAISLPETFTANDGTNVSRYSIYRYAFYNCVGLTSVTIPDSVTSIGEYAFYNCSGLTSVTIPDSVTSIGEYAFYNCSGLAEVTIGNGVTSIREYAFYNCSSLTSVTIGNGVTSIGIYAFSGCSGLTSVRIPDSVTYIVWNAFSGCSGLKSVTIGNGVTSIGDEAFYNCSNLISVTIPDSVTSIGEYAFWGCSSLTSLKIPDSVTSIGNSAFENCSSLTSVTIGNGVKSIGDRAFIKCYKLIEIYNNSSIDIIAGSSNNGFVAHYAKRVLTNEEDSNLTIDESGFIFYYDGVDNAYLMGYSGNKTAISLPETFTANDGTNVSRYSIYRYAFYNCVGLTSVTIPDSVTSIEWHAFENCSSLTEVTIPDSVTSIRDYAFYNCSGLQSVTIGNGVTSIGYGAFENCYKLIEIYNNSSIDIIAGSSNNGYVAYYAKRVLTNEEDSKLTIDESGFIFYYDGVDNAYLMGYSGNKTAISLPETFTANDGTNVSRYSIYNYAFYNCVGLTSVTIPDSVTSIGSYAFEGCTAEIVWGDEPVITEIGDDAFAGYKGTSFVIPDSVTSIGEYAFYNCSGLTSVTIPDSVKSIGRYAFYGCSGLTSVTIPDSVKSIGEYAFYNCSGLQSVTIGKGVTRIGIGAFYNCSVLTSATFKNIMGWVQSLYSLPYYNLARKSTAASYLSLHYASTTWRRS